MPDNLSPKEGHLELDGNTPAITSEPNNMISKLSYPVGGTVSMPQLICSESAGGDDHHVAEEMEHHTDQQVAGEMEHHTDAENTLNSLQTRGHRPTSSYNWEQS